MYIPDDPAPEIIGEIGRRFEQCYITRSGRAVGITGVIGQIGHISAVDIAPVLAQNLA
jgi:hypothetical protein